MRRRVLVCGRNAHQAVHRQIQAARIGDQGCGFRRHARRPSAVPRRYSPGQKAAEICRSCRAPPPGRRPVGYGPGSECSRTAPPPPDLVGLQRADQMQFQVGTIAFQCGKLVFALPAPGSRRTGVGPRPAPARMPASSTVLDTATSLVAAAGWKAAFRAAAMRARMTARFSGMLMPDALSRAKLARAAARLNAGQLAFL